MTLDEFYTMLCGMGIPAAYRVFTKSVSPPFIVYYEDSSDNFNADDLVYSKASSITTELYTDKKDTALEARLEGIFDAGGIVFRKSEVYIDSEKLFEVIYVTEV